MVSSKNADQSEEDYKRYVQKSQAKLSALERKLENKGISVTCRPVDVPDIPKT